MVRNAQIALAGIKRHIETHETDFADINTKHI